MKTRLVVALVGLAISFALPNFAQQTVDPKIEQQIRALAQKYDAAINNHDPAAVAALYTETGLGKSLSQKYPQVTVERASLSLFAVKLSGLLQMRIRGVPASNRARFDGSKCFGARRRAQRMENASWEGNRLAL